jgi:hypothetical protein
MSRPILNFLVAFLCVFGGLSLAHGPGPPYSKAHAALGNLIADRPLGSGVQLHFAAPDDELRQHPWRVTLHVVPPASAQHIAIPIDIRSLLFLPTAAFIALAIAAPLPSLRAHLKLIGLGLLILEPLLVLLIALPLLSFLGGNGPVQVFTLSRPTHVVLQILYRALVAPPGMAYALPLFLWWVLVVELKRGNRKAPSIEQSA